VLVAADQKVLAGGHRLIAEAQVVRGSAFAQLALELHVAQSKCFAGFAIRRVLVRCWRERQAQRDRHEEGGAGDTEAAFAEACHRESRWSDRIAV
jgi:hypothetical protein